MKLAFRQEVRNLIVTAYWEINEIVRNHFEARDETWYGTFVEGRFVLHPFHELQDFLKISFKNPKKDLQSPKSVIQLGRDLIQTTSTGVKYVLRIVWK